MGSFGFEKLGIAGRICSDNKRYYKRYDIAVCVSENVRRSFVELYQDTVSTETIYNTIDDSEIAVKALAELPIGVKSKSLLLQLSAGCLLQSILFVR